MAESNPISFEGNKRADPTQSSVFSNDDGSLILHKEQSLMENPKFIDNDGRIFFQIETDKDGADQMLLSRILKGIVPVADVIIKMEGDEPVYYSYKMPLEDIQRKPLASGDHPSVNRYMWILDKVFNDHDHCSDDSSLANSGNLSSDKGKYYFYDFDAFGRNFWAYFIPSSVGGTLDKFSKTDLNYLHVYLGQIRDRLAGQKGLDFLNDIVDNMKKFKAEPDVIKNAHGEDRVAVFQSEVVNRVDVCVKKIADELEYRKQHY